MAGNADALKALITWVVRFILPNKNDGHTEVIGTVVTVLTAIATFISYVLPVLQGELPPTP